MKSHYIKYISIDQKITFGTGLRTHLNFVGNSTGDENNCPTSAISNSTSLYPTSQFFYLQVYLANLMLQLTVVAVGLTGPRSYLFPFELIAHILTFYTIPYFTHLNYNE